MDVNRFVGREDVYALQTDAGSYVPVKKPITEQDLKDHLDGKKTLGTYVLDKDNNVKFGCIDIDNENLAEAKLIGEFIYSLFSDFDRILEFSGRRGYHVWIFMKKKEPAKFVRDLIKTRLRREGIDDIEIFPKQTELSGKGFGNLIKIPLGIHKGSGKRSEIMREDNATKI
jgi:hypothetical protein